MEKSNKKQLIGLFFAIILGGVFTSFMALTQTVSMEAACVCGIFVGSLYLWITRAIDWTSLLCLALLGMLPSIGFTKVFANSFGNSTFAFLLFTFICTYALAQTPFLKRAALVLLQSPLAKKGSWGFFVSFLMAVYGIGLFVSPTVLFVVFLPVYEEICELVGLKKGNKTAQGLLFSMIMMIALSAGATPIGHVFSVMAMGLYQTATGMSISYLAYMGMAIPVTVVIALLTVVTMYGVYKIDLTVFNQLDMQPLQKELPPMSKRERYTVMIFAGVIVLWLLPEFVTFFTGEKWGLSTYGTAFPPLVATVLMAVFSVEGKPLLSLQEAFAKGVHWPSLIMAGTTLALSSAFTMKEIGLVTWLQEVITPHTQGLSTLLLVALFVTWAAVQTNFSSNLVTVSVVTTIAIPLLQQSGVAVSIPAVASLIGLMASLAYATPPSMPYVAISVGSGWLSAKMVFVYGMWMMCWSILVAIIIGYPLAAMMM